MKQGISTFILQPHVIFPILRKWTSLSHDCKFIRSTHGLVLSSDIFSKYFPNQLPNESVFICSDSGSSDHMLKDTNTSYENKTIRP